MSADTELQNALARLSIAESRVRQLEADNAALAARAALAVTQEADARQAHRVIEFSFQRCYRCDHYPNSPDPGCACCVDDHTPDSDGDFTTATADEFKAMQQ